MGLTERQRQMIEDARTRRQEATRAAGLHDTREAAAKVSPEEYQKRLREMVARDNAIVSTAKEERLARAREEWREVVGSRWADATVEDPALNDLIQRKVRNIISNGPQHRNGLVLAGNLGVGKTWAAYGYARALVEAGALLPKSLMHGTESGLLLPLMSLGYDRPRKMGEFLDKNYRFYLIDDVGRAFTRDVGLLHEVWYEILNHAYENHIPIALTTNKRVEREYNRGLKRETSELEQWIGDAAFDRLMAIAERTSPAGGNKRARVNQMMDDGQTLGITNSPKLEDDPFAGLGATPPRRDDQSSRWDSGRHSGPHIPRSTLSDSDLRPDRI